MPYNIISCAGWEAGTGSWIASSPCLKARLGLVFLFFIIAVVRRWGGEELGIGFSFLFGLIGSLLPYFIIVTIFGSFKIAMVVGIVGGLIGGYVGGMFFGGEDY